MNWDFPKWTRGDALLNLLGTLLAAALIAGWLLFATANNEFWCHQFALVESDVWTWAGKLLGQTAMACWLG